MLHKLYKYSGITRLHKQRKHNGIAMIHTLIFDPVITLLYKLHKRTVNVKIHNL